MDRTSVLLTGAAIGVIVIVGGIVWSAEKGKVKEKGEDATEVVAMAQTATVSIEQAIKTAVENFPGKVVEAELGQKHGKTAWEVEILTSEQGVMVVRIDAESGSVITTEQKTAPGNSQAQEGNR